MRSPNRRARSSSCREPVLPETVSMFLISVKLRRSTSQERDRRDMRQDLIRRELPTGQTTRLDHFVELQGAVGGEWDRRESQRPGHERELIPTSAVMGMDGTGINGAQSLMDRLAAHRQPVCGALKLWLRGVVAEVNRSP